MKTLAGTVVAVAILTACTHVDDRPQSIDTSSTYSGHEQQPADTPATGDVGGDPQPHDLTTNASVQFIDFKSFDKTLSSRLREDPPAVTVTFEAPTTVNDIPERLRKWLTVVEKYDGNVEFREDPDYQMRAMPGIFSIVAGAFLMAYKAISDKILYSPAKDYNATVFYIKGNGRITKAVFLRKEHHP